MHVENGENKGCLMLLDLISVVMSEKHFRKGALEIEKYTILWIIRSEERRVGKEC